MTIKPSKSSLAAAVLLLSTAHCGGGGGTPDLCTKICPLWTQCERASTGGSGPALVCSTNMSSLCESTCSSSLDGLGEVEGDFVSCASCVVKYVGDKVCNYDDALQIAMVSCADSCKSAKAGAGAKLFYDQFSNAYDDAVASACAPPDLAEPDLAPRPPCNPVTQQGCDPGQKCVIGGTCEPDGTQRVGDPCTSTSACQAGTGCSSDDVCRQYCYNDGDCTAGSGPGGYPNIPYCLDDGAGSIKSCTTPCNAVLAAGSSGCTNGLACVYNMPSSGLEYTDCESPGSAAVDTSCSSSWCQPGSTCTHGGQTGLDLCRRNCRLSVSSDCPSSYSCVAFTNGGHLDLGICCPSSGC
jgi:hypothetical protein